MSNNIKPFITRAALTLALAMLTAATGWAQTTESVTYIDADGTEKTVTATVLTRDMDNLGTDGQTTWYVVNGEVNDFLVSGLSIHGNVNIILADGCSFQVPGSSSWTYDAGFTGTGNLTFYGQTAGTGTVSPCSDAPFINVLNGDVTLCSGNIDISNNTHDAISLTGTFTVLGGSVSVKTAGSNGVYRQTAIKASAVDIRGGSVTASGPNAIEATTVNISGGTVKAYTNGGDAEEEEYGFAIMCNTFNFSGGNVTAGYEYIYNGQTRVGIDANHINLSWTSPTDRILSEKKNDNTISYYGTVTIAQGKPFKVGSTTYMGTLTEVQKEALANQTLEPDLSLAATGDGSAAHPYYINATETWNDFCDALQDNDTYNRFTGKTVQLGADITVSRMAGSSQHEFTGTFDGGNHTLTVSISNSNGNAAPFREIMGATIRNLKVSGSVSGHKHSAGLVSYARGADSSVENTIENCLVATDVSTIVDTDGDCYLGGIVGHGFNCKLTIRGCAFTGSLTSPHNYTGGLQGWSDGNTLVLENDLFAASSVNAANVGFHPIAFHVNNATTTATVSNVYYTVAPTCTAATRIAAAGKQARSITAGQWVTVSHAGVANTYSASGITAYKANSSDVNYTAGIAYAPDGDTPATLYAGSGDVVSLTLGHEDRQGYTFNYQASAGTISGSTLTMPNADVTITVGLSVIDWATQSTGEDADHAYMIYNKDQLLLLAYRVNGTHGETRQEDGYYGKYFKLGADIDFTSADMAFDGGQSNYEAIGGYYNNTDCSFRGHFDGDGNTVSGIRIRKDGTDYAAYYQGLFGMTQDASIHDVRLTDARITGCSTVGGIVGRKLYGTVSNCTVTESDITATVNNCYGIIFGFSSFGTLTNNYYHGCTVNGNAVTSGAGCNGADITANNGAVPVFTLSLANGVSTTTGPTITLDNTGYYAQGTAIALSYSGTPGGAPLGYQYGFTASAGTLNGNTLTMPDQDVTVSALRSTGEAVEVSYVDADGNTQKHDAIALDGTEYGLGTSGNETWYFVGLPTIAFDHRLDLNGDVNLILPDGCTMNVTSSNDDGIYTSSGNITIYGQTDGTGTLNATSEYGAGIHSYNGDITISGGRVTATSGNSNGIFTDSGTINISGGTVTATGGTGISTDSGTINISGGTVTATGGNGIYTNSGTINISGGTVTATSKYGNGIFTSSGKITISGGRVTATATATSEYNAGIFTNSGTITLGCTTASDFIYASSYYVAEGTLKIAGDQTLYDEDGNYYSGTYYGFIIPDGATLRPLPNVLALYDSEDNSEAISGSNEQQRNVILYGRTLYKDGAWNTLCLPFDVTLEGSPLDGATAKTVIGTTTSGNDITINFGNPDSTTEPVTVLKAGVPYIIKWDATNTNIVEPVFNGVTVVSSSEADRTVTVANGAVKLVGYYDALSLDPAGSDDFAASVVPSIYYMTADNTLKHTGKARTLRACRAYFQFDETADAREIRLNFGDETTEVKEVKEVREVKDDSWYTVDGVKLNGKPTRKGLYIFNGNKVVIK